MTDWAERNDIRNYGIKHETSARNLGELLLIILSPLLAAGVLTFYAWGQSQIISIGYENQRLLETEETLLRSEQALILEEATLKDPARIDAIARNLLGMSTLRAHQVLLPRRAATELALAGTTVATAETGDTH